MEKYYIYFESDFEYSLAFFFLILFSLVVTLFVRVGRGRYELYKSKIKPLIKLNLNFLIFILFISLFIELSNYGDVKSAESKVEGKRVYTVTGFVDELNVEVLSSRTEKLKVGGVLFEYNNYSTYEYCFANRNYNEGVIFEGAELSLDYIEDGRRKCIVKVLVKK
ncbi:hypothetical protein CWB99_04400 [Pseudoalteromonas rubra]|uniref:Uncharacterized protein n=1 Tax=Pseudoalteromonas rubra TaxID=43658 RepID=A0A5S3WRN1_9GAMM|nr:hypothetical protein [Pseudoalteromonas rubra]TMP31498.1 hypothetical protein CWB99_04400 [Pseudoalteromonas rubra]TMP34582.1 hypothetical protein CWC00_07305 [Pseudoalteromonas rubra]